MGQPVNPEDIASILEIQALKARYFRYVDTKNWSGLTNLFAEDATLFFPEAQSEPVGLKDAIDFISTGLEGGTSIHHGHMPEIEILSPTAARGIWAMEDRIFWPSNSPSRLGLEYLHGYGHYHEEYARPSDCWLIAKLKVTRIWSRAIAPAHSAQ